MLGVEADYYADLERGRLQEPIPGEIEERIAQALHLDGEYREELATRLRAVYEVSPAAPETPAQASGLHRASPGSPTPFASSPGSSASAPPSAQPAPASPQTSAAAGAAYPAARYSTPAPASPASPTSTPTSETALSPAAIPTTQPVQYGISPAARAEQVAHTGQPEQAEPPFSSFTQASRTAWEQDRRRDQVSTIGRHTTVQLTGEQVKARAAVEIVAPVASRMGIPPDTFGGLSAFDRYGLRAYPEVITHLLSDTTTQRA